MCDMDELKFSNAHTDVEWTKSVIGICPSMMIQKIVEKLSKLHCKMPPINIAVNIYPLPPILMITDHRNIARSQREKCAKIILIIDFFSPIYQTTKTFFSCACASCNNKWLLVQFYCSFTFSQIVVYLFAAIANLYSTEWKNPNAWNVVATNSLKQILD